jgi:hypothetical protein
VLTPQPRGLALARQLERMSPAAQRLLTEHSRWWPTKDGGICWRIAAPPEDMDALRELAHVLCSGLDLDVERAELDLERAELDDPPEPVGDGDGLTFDEFQELLRQRRETAASP